MNLQGENKTEWYVRRGSTVQGPYCAADVRRYLLLGRIRLSDRVSLDAARWEPITQCDELIPNEMRDLGSEAGRARFEVARRAADDRSVDGEGDWADAAGESTHDRSETGHRRGWRMLFVLTGLVIVVGSLLAIGYYRDFGPGLVQRVDCSASAADQVVWDGCIKDGLAPGARVGLAGLSGINASLRRARLPGADLAGARLDYADLTRAHLKGADLHSAVLRGSTLKETDLAGVDLRHADLRNADLRDARLEGAELKGARLGNALWINGRACAADAVGQCR